jgi:hypothetical protein
MVEEILRVVEPGAVEAALGLRAVSDQLTRRSNGMEADR